MDHNKAFEFTEKLSIIIPAYNEEEGIESTIRELLDYEPLSGAEIIVVNDGSKDNQGFQGGKDCLHRGGDGLYSRTGCFLCALCRFPSGLDCCLGRLLCPLCSLYRSLSSDFGGLYRFLLRFNCPLSLFS